jgi:hypothetical protein
MSKLAMALVAILLPAHFAGAADFPSTAWPQDLLCRQHDPNNASGIFFTREFQIRFHTPQDAEVELRLGMSYYQAHDVCFTKEFQLVSPLGPTGVEVKGKFECAKDSSTQGAPTETQNLDLLIDFSVKKLSFNGTQYDCRWQEFWQ